MARFVHPSLEALNLPDILAALGDPVRLSIVRKLQAKGRSCMACHEASPCPDIPKSTLSHHFRILRDAGIVRTVKQGVENRNTLRTEDLQARFPGLLKAILKCADS